VRTTVNLNRELLAEAARLTGVSERTALIHAVIHAGLRALIERESARRLARRGVDAPVGRR